MILGAGVFQLPIIEKVKQLGFSAIVVSTQGNYPGFNFADKSYFIDVREKERILNIAKKEKITGIVTDQTDIAVPSVAYIAEKMGLRGISYNCALNFTNKFRLHQLCDYYGVQVPKYFGTGSINEGYEIAKKMKLPFIIKPVDNQGSRGVNKVNNLSEFPEKFRNSISYSKEEYVIIENFIKGREIVAGGFVSQFKHTNLSLGDREYFDFKDIFIPKRTFFPSKINDKLRDKIFDINSHLIDSLKPEFGITHNEYLIEDETDEVYLIEAAIRGGGVYISSDLLPASTGVEVELLLLELASGLKQTVEIYKNGYEPRSAGYICFSLPEGEIKSVSGMEDLSNLYGVTKYDLSGILTGIRTKAIQDKSMRYGPIIITGKDRNDCSEIADSVEKTFIVKVETKDGLKGINW
jgi:carbamoyl-phosphate synthase large subunit